LPKNWTVSSPNLLRITAVIYFHMDMTLVIYVWIDENLSKPNNVVKMNTQQRNSLTSEKVVPGE
jgi:hypothetical protein